jgi:L-aminopeptidase/D-esterase-like protein
LFRADVEKDAGMARPGARNDLTDVAGIAVGSAEDPVARTGVTVVLPEERAVCAVDVRGGGPGTRETDALSAENLVDAVDAVVLAGGSVYGLAAADAVTASLGARGRGFALADKEGVPPSPVVPAAILYDLANDGDKGWGREPPYRRLGADALSRATSAPVALGASGAGFGARAGDAAGGLGSASIVTGDGLTVAALAAVNCFGSPYIPGSQVFWAWPFETDGEFGGARPVGVEPVDSDDWGAAKANPAARENTTIAAVATDAVLTPAQAKRVAVMAQDGLARAIRPAHAPFDGDVVFVLSTGRVELPAAVPLAVARLGSLAADTLARAIARGVHEAGRPS